MWYVLEKSTESKEIGEYPQLQDLNGKNNNNSIVYEDQWGLNYREDEIQFEFKMSSRAKFTNVLSASFLTPDTILCDKKAITLFSGIPQIKTFKALVDSKQYFVLNCTLKNLDKVDFQKSTLAKTEYTKFREYVKLESLDEYTKRVGDFNDEMIYFDRIFLKAGIYQSILYLDAIKHFIVNEDFKIESEELGISGVAFVPLDKFSVVRF